MIDLEFKFKVGQPVWSDGGMPCEVVGMELAMNGKDKLYQIKPFCGNGGNRLSVLESTLCESRMAYLAKRACSLFDSIAYQQKQLKDLLDDLCKETANGGEDHARSSD